MILVENPFSKPMANQRYTHLVGIDVSKHTLDVMLWCAEPEPPSKKAFHITNDAAGHRRLIHWLKQHKAPPETTVLCMEHTGRYNEVLLEHLTLVGWICSVEKTTVLKKVQPEHHRKDDPYDADLLAEYAYRYSDKLHLYQAPDPTIEQIRLLYRERRRLVTQRAAVKQLRSEQGYNRPRPPSQAEAVVAKLRKAQLAFYDEQIQALEQQMKALAESDQRLQDGYEQLKGIDGIGEKTAFMWLCLFYGQVHLDARRIASRFGFAPHGSTSGTSRNRRAHSTGHGNSEVRKMLTLCARSAGAHHEKYRQYKTRKLAEGKASQLVTNNIINKLIRVVCAVWNDDTVFDPSHVSRFVQIATSAS